AARRAAEKRARSRSDGIRGSARPAADSGGGLRASRLQAGRCDGAGHGHPPRGRDAFLSKHDPPPPAGTFTRRAASLDRGALVMKEVCLAVLLVLAHRAASAPSPADLAKAVDAYVAPYVAYRCFSGVILVAKGDEILLECAWGMANYELGVPNTP